MFGMGVAILLIGLAAACLIVAVYLSVRYRGSSFVDKGLANKVVKEKK